MQLYISETGNLWKTIQNWPIKNDSSLQKGIFFIGILG